MQLAVLGLGHQQRRGVSLGACLGELTRRQQNVGQNRIAEGFILFQFLLPKLDQRLSDRSLRVGVTPLFKGYSCESELILGGIRLFSKLLADG